VYIINDLGVGFSGIIGCRGKGQRALGFGIVDVAFVGKLKDFIRA